LFVADYINDYLYDFELSEDSSKLNLEGELVDKIANDNGELKNVALEQGFGVITDIKEGSDGYRYILSP
jgi:aldose sugar dehydrogenase